MGKDERIEVRRTYGRVDEHDGEYIETEFTRLGSLPIPLLPGRSYWIVDDRGTARMGFRIRLDARSVAAAYLRIWAPAIAIAVLVLGGSSLATAIAVALFGLSAWSWTWWPRDAAERRRSDFDRAALGSRCDPARMTDQMHQRLADELATRASADADPRSPDDVVRFGARTVDEALRAYGLLRLTDARDPRPPGSLQLFHGIERRISAVRQLRRRASPYRDRLAADTLDLWTTLSDSVQASAGEHRAAPPGSRAVPAPAVALPGFVRQPWLWFAVLVVSTVVSGVALSGAETPRPAPRRALARPPAPELPRGMPRLVSREELAQPPMGEYIRVPCDAVQNSDSGPLREVTLCVVGPHILAVTGGNRRHDIGRVLLGHLEPLPDDPSPDWVHALRDQMLRDPRSYHVYLQRMSYGDDTHEELDHQDDGSRITGYAIRRGETANGDHTDEEWQHALAVAAGLATLAGWFVWIRLWQLRRRAATWIVTG